jgi:hypothetical protein
MGYWKREYTERRTGKPLFLAETKAEDPPPPSPPEKDDKGKT